MAVTRGTSGTNAKPASGGKTKMAAPGAWGPERWVAVLVLLALGLLILIRMGFRGVGVAGARVSVS